MAATSFAGTRRTVRSPVLSLAAWAAVAALYGTASAATPEPSDAIEAWVEGLPQPPEEASMASGYRFARPAFDALLDLAGTRGGVVQLEVIGHSIGEAPLVAVHISDPTQPITDDVLVVAGIHALEWVGTESALALIDAHARRPTPGVRLTVVPLANPDGRARVESDLLTDNVGAYRRGNQALVDLNRDFEMGREAKAIWRHVLPMRFGTSPAPLSQPESRALSALADRHPYRAVVSLHAFGGYLYHPFSSSWRRPEDWEGYVRTGRSMEQAQGAGAFRTRQLARWGFFFRAHGTELDHFHRPDETQSWLLEISRSGLASPADRKTPFRWYNPRRSTPHVKRTVAAVDALLDTGPRRIAAGTPHAHR